MEPAGTVFTDVEFGTSVQRFFKTGRVSVTVTLAGDDVSGNNDTFLGSTFLILLQRDGDVQGYG